MTTTTTKLLGAFAAGTFLFAACGSDSGGSDSVGENQQKVADLFIESLATEAMEYDEDCINEAVGMLSDDDAAKIVEAGIDGDPDVSDDATAAGEKLISCIAFPDFSSLPDED